MISNRHSTFFLKPVTFVIFDSRITKVGFGKIWEKLGSVLSVGFWISALSRMRVAIRVNGVTLRRAGR
jgi:hypothetical protein